VHLLPPQHLNLVVAAHGQLVDGGIAPGVEHVQESAPPVEPAVAVATAPIAGPDGKHVHVVDGAELLEIVADRIDRPVVRAVGDEELAPLVEGDQGTPGHVGGWHRHDYRLNGPKVSRRNRKQAIDDVLCGTSMCSLFHSTT